MPSLANLDAYAVEIQVPLPDGQWRHGSGYVIGPCRILTALHVLVGQDDVKQGRPVSAPARIEVRAYGDFAERFGPASDVATARYLDSVRALARDGDYLWRPANLLSPKDGAAMPRFELAILEVKPEAALKHILNAPRIKCLKPTRDLGCRCTGFPDWAAMRLMQGVDVANPRPVTGDLSFSAPTNDSFHPFTAKNGAPQTEKEWQGLSGSAFLTQDTGALVGVASAILPTKDNAGLWMTQLADLAEGDEFGEFWTAAGLARPSRFQMPAGTSLPQFLIDPLPYLHEFDRSKPADRVLDVFDPIPGEGAGANAAEQAKAISQDETCAPPIFLIAGRWIDLPDEMVQRIRRKLVPDFIGIRDGDATVLRWRHSIDGYSAGQIVAKLKEEIASSLNVVRPRRVASLESLRERAKGRDWYLFIRADKANAEDAKALCEILSEFAKFGPSQRPPTLYVNIVPGDAGATIAAEQDLRVANFLRMVRQDSAAFAEHLLIIDTLYLHDCEFEDIQIWTKDLEQYCRVTAEQCRTYLERAFSSGTFPLQDVKLCLSSSALAR